MRQSVRQERAPARAPAPATESRSRARNGIRNPNLAPKLSRASWRPRGAHHIKCGPTEYRTDSVTPIYMCNPFFTGDGVPVLFTVGTFPFCSLSVPMFSFVHCQFQIAIGTLLVRLRVLATMVAAISE